MFKDATAESILRIIITIKERNTKIEKHGYSNFGFVGPCTISHHQYSRMVDLLIERHMHKIENNNIEIAE